MISYHYKLLARFGLLHLVVGGPGPSLDISLVGGFVGPDLCGRADEVGEQGVF